MARKDNVRFSNRFLPPRLKCKQGKHFRSASLEVFPEGHWSSLKFNLELQGCTPVQIKMIQDLMHNGWSLAQSLKQVSLKIGRCSTDSRKFL